MKKIFTLIVAFVASIMVANAQFGIIAGVQKESTAIDKENFAANFENINLYHVGMAFKLPLPFGFAVQPELLYQMKGADLTETYNAAVAGEDLSEKGAEFSTKDGFAELGLGIQWGLDIVAFRPFVFAKPFVGYRLTGEENFSEIGEISDEEIENAKSRLEFGYSVGAGLEFLEHFQLSLEYFNNLGKMFNEGEFDADAKKEAILAGYKDLENYGGIKLTFAFLF